MQKINFNDAVESVTSSDSRYAGDAYYFLQEVLTQAVNKQRKDTGGEDRHVSGEELLKIFRARAKKKFGPMAISVFEEWGIRSCEDVGEIVFNLIDVGAFGTSDQDRREDFSAGYDFRDAFVTPFLPVSKRGTESRTGPRHHQ
jgi:uncharacterized repeat protein (TIGR04138 family)